MSSAQQFETQEPTGGPMPENKSVTILGSTGSIGVSTLDLIRDQRARHGGDRMPIAALTANRRVDELIAQALEFKPQFAAIAEADLYDALKDGLAGTGIEVAAGPQAVCEAAARESDWVMAAIVGAAGLEPTLAAIRRGSQIALANKECLVCAGDLVAEEIEKHRAVLLPVDSEHNAIFQVLDPGHMDAIGRIILTASGGPFRTWTHEEMEPVTPERAVKHPNWSMGAKISIDSATMMNKGLELIEAAYLFPIPTDDIVILVHPQSVIHSMVEYVDGSVLAQLGSPDMRTPIAHTLAWPKRMPTPAERLRLEKVATLTFEEPDTARFPSLRLARESLNAGHGAPTILNAANEVAVEAFMNRTIGFLDIVRVVERTLEGVQTRFAADRSLTLEDVLSLDAEARTVAVSELAKC